MRYFVEGDFSELDKYKDYKHKEVKDASYEFPSNEIEKKAVLYAGRHLISKRFKDILFWVLVSLLYTLPLIVGMKGDEARNIFFIILFNLPLVVYFLYLVKIVIEYYSSEPKLIKTICLGSFVATRINSKRGSQNKYLSVVDIENKILIEQVKIKKSHYDIATPGEVIYVVDNGELGCFGVLEKIIPVNNDDIDHERESDKDFSYLKEDATKLGRLITIFSVIICILILIVSISLRNRDIKAADTNNTIENNVEETTTREFYSKEEFISKFMSLGLSEQEANDLIKKQNFAENAYTRIFEITDFSNLTGEEIKNELLSFGFTEEEADYAVTKYINR